MTPAADESPVTSRNAFFSKLWSLSCVIFVCDRIAQRRRGKSGIRKGVKRKWKLLLYISATSFLHWYISHKREDWHYLFSLRANRSGDSIVPPLVCVTSYHVVHVAGGSGSFHLLLHSSKWRVWKIALLHLCPVFALEIYFDCYSARTQSSPLKFSDPV